jgi:uncharacterized protein YbjT (DUF2867 family)
MILLCGSTGELGGRIAQVLSEQGVPFRAMVRSGRPTRELEALDAEIVHADLTEPDTLDRAVAGVSTVITTANAMVRLLSGDRSVSIATVDVLGNRALIERAERAGVSRFVFTSMAGLSRDTARLSPLAAAKLATEERLRTSAMRSVIVRPDKFQEVWLSPATGIDPGRGKALIYGRGRVPEAYVAQDDVARLIVALSVEADPPAFVEFGGAQRLTRLEVADAMDAAFGVVMRRRHVPRPVLRAGATLLSRAKPEIASLMGLALYSDTHEITWDSHPLSERGITPRSTTDYIGRLAATASP